MLLDSNSLMILELPLLLGDSAGLGRLQKMLRRITKVKQAMVSLKMKEPVTTLC